MGSKRFGWWFSLALIPAEECVGERGGHTPLLAGLPLCNQVLPLYAGILTPAVIFQHNTKIHSYVGAAAVELQNVSSETRPKAPCWPQSVVYCETKMLVWGFTHHFGLLWNCLLKASIPRNTEKKWSLKPLKGMVKDKDYGHLFPDFRSWL